jgi:hypothetical protein
MPLGKWLRVEGKGKKIGHRRSDALQQTIHRRKRLIFRRLSTFFTIFQGFFTPYFRWKWLVCRLLRISHGHKRHTDAKFKVQIPSWKPRNTRNARKNEEMNLELKKSERATSEKFHELARRGETGWCSTGAFIPLDSRAFRMIVLPLYEL